MRSRYVRLGFIFPLVLLLLAAIPRIFNYQAKLVQSPGVGVNDTLEIKFRLYNTDSGGSPLWEETIPDVPISGGLFNVELGRLNPFSEDVDFSDRYWLEVIVEDDTLSPRHPFNPVPYAIRSVYADTSLSTPDCIENQYAEDQSASFRISGDGYVGGELGVGVVNPTAKVDIDGTLQTRGFKMPTGAADNYVLTSDGSGVGTWQELSSISSDGDWQITGNDMYSLVSGNVGIGTTNPGAALAKLRVESSNSPVMALNGLSSSSWVTFDFERMGVHRADWGLSPEGTFGGNAFVLASYKDSWTDPLVIENGAPTGALYIRENGSVGIGTTSPSSSYRLDVNGALRATSKSFHIPHPLYPETKSLVHGSLEGPEFGVYYRGTARLQNGKAVIALPPYFEALTREDERTVQLTPIGTDPYCLSYTPIKDGKFKVYGSVPEGEFSWEVKAVRADIPRLLPVEENSHANK